MNLIYKKITYLDLNKRANQLARYLHCNGIKNGTLVGIAINRSIDLVVALFAIMKVGCSYLPLDPKNPSERLMFILNDANIKFLITQNDLINLFSGHKGKIVNLDKEKIKINRKSSDNLFCLPSLDQLAYVIYTSGSTGLAKGIEILQRSLHNLLCASQMGLRISNKDTWLTTTTIAFDMSIMEILFPLIHGATCLIVSEKLAIDSLILSKKLEERKVTIMEATPTTWKMLLDAGWQGKKDLSIVCGGEQLDYSLVEQLMNQSKAVWNRYGPTETTIYVSEKKLEQRKPVTIGRPIANTTFYVLNEDLQLVPIGAPGELYIGGIGLARRYRNRPDLTAEKFVKSPFKNSLSEKLYKTGDLVRYLSNGELEFLGRIDYQVKIRGHRIELGEIENVLLEHEGVYQTVVIVRENNDDKRLVAYFTGNGKVDELREFLASRLPSYMLVSAYVRLDKFPVNVNGKIDRNALLKQNYSCISEESFVAPKSVVENELAKIWSDVLGTKLVSTKSDFFKIGGHSLLAVKTVNRINKHFSINISVKSFFEKPTICSLAMEVERLLHGDNKCFLSKIEIINRNDGDPLSYSQKRLWFLDKLEGGSRAYNIHFALDLKGKLKISLLIKAINEIVQRHEALRTIFVEEDGLPRQKFINDLQLKFKTIDISNSENPLKMSSEVIETESDKTFNLSQGPLLRTILITVGKNHHILLVCTHHIVFDGWSINIFLQELQELYSAFVNQEQHSLKHISVQYADYTRWQIKYLKTIRKQQLLWWKHRLNNAPSILNLPLDYKRTTVQTYNGRTFKLVLKEQQAYALRKLADENNVTLFMVFFAAFSVLLHRYTGQEDFVVGTPVSGRSHFEVEKIIGCFINTLALRVSLKPNQTFLSFLKNVKKVALDAYAHQELPFEEVINNLKINRSLNYSPLFQVMFNMIEQEPVKKMGNVVVDFVKTEHKSAHFDLSLSILDNKKDLICEIEYNTDLFKLDTVKRMALHFQNLLDVIINNPRKKINHIELLNNKEKHKQLVEWNKQEISYPQNQFVHKLFEKQVDKTPNAVALIFKDKKLSFKELNEKANYVANQLIISERKIVAIGTDRCMEFIVAVLGVLKSGKAYVPIDSSLPIDRIKEIMNDTQVGVILTTKDTDKFFSSLGYTLCVDKLNNKETTNLDISLKSTDLAYIIYTSGSSGNPKGVEIDHGSISDRVIWKNEKYKLSSKDVILHTYSFVFDGSIINYFWSLCYGVPLVIASKEEILGNLSQLIKKYKITIVDLLPSLISTLNKEDCVSLKNVFSGGEALPGEIVRKFYKEFNAKLHNTYGPTEATVESSVWESERDFADDLAPIGKAIAGAKLYVLDKCLNVVPIGVHGELHIGGFGLSSGYRNKPELTRQKFIKDTFSNDPKAKMYKTGDLVKYREDGNIEFIGRIDNQVKIRGFRVELGEIESAIRKVRNVKDVVVIFHNERLIAYIISNMNIIKSIKDKLVTLPDYMMPHEFVQIKSFPKLPSGKVDVTALPKPISRKEKNICLPKNHLEHQLLCIWQKLLNIESISTQDNFFDIGGHSLLAVRLIANIKSLLKISLPLVSLFQHPTIRSLSAALKNSQTSNWSPLVSINLEKAGNPFFCVHPVGGNVLCYRDLARYFDRPFYGLQERGLEDGQIPHKTIVDMAREYIEAIKQVNPHGPYFIGGWSFGGLVAAEMAYQLERTGNEMEQLILIDTIAEIDKIKAVDVNDEACLLAELSHNFNIKLDKNKKLSDRERLANLIEYGSRSEEVSKAYAKKLSNLAKANYRALQTFELKPINCNVLLAKTKQHNMNYDLGWNKYAKDLEVIEVEGDHWTMIQKPLVKDLVTSLKNRVMNFDNL